MPVDLTPIVVESLKALGLIVPAWLYYKAQRHKQKPKGKPQPSAKHDAGDAR